MAPDLPQIPSISPAYPATTKQAAGTIDGIDTDVTSTVFSDKIMITITQGGRLAQWVYSCESVSPPNPSSDNVLDSCAFRLPQSQLCRSVHAIW